jgi:hypothetical protein
LRGLTEFFSHTYHSRGLLLVMKANRDIFLLPLLRGRDGLKDRGAILRGKPNP